MQGTGLWKSQNRGARRVAVLWALGALVSFMLSSPSALAQDKDELARSHFESGAAYFAEAEYEEALRAFRKAYELSERPQILLNIAVVEERLGDLKAAVATLDQYIASNPSDPELETIRLRRDNLQKRADEADAGGADAPPPAPTPAPAAAPPPAPPPSAQAAPPPPSDPARDGPNLLPAYVSISVGALAGVAAVITGLGARAEYEELEDNCSPNCSSDDTSTGEALALTSTALTGVAVLGVGLGTYLWLSAEDDETSGATPRLSVAAGPAGGYAHARWRF